MTNILKAGNYRLGPSNINFHLQKKEQTKQEMSFLSSNKKKIICMSLPD